MDMAALEILMTERGQALLAALPPYSPDTALTLTTQLRGTGLAANLVAEILTQSRLRARARAKFAHFTDHMLFTPAGLEQATRLPIAARHADRLRKAGVKHVADMTCGIGGDAMAMAALGLQVTAIDADEAAATVAGFNLRHFPDATVLCADSLRLDLAGADGVWADPARRSGGKRTHDPASYTPSLAQILELRERVPTLGVKVGPGISYTDIPSECAAEWTSVDGDLLDATLWFGAATHTDGSDTTGTRTAVVMGKDGTHTLRDDGATPAVGPVGSFLLEPDAAVIRAHAIGALAALLGDAWLIDPTIAYLATATAALTPFARCYRVTADMPFSIKQLRREVRARDIGELIVKKRGTAVTPADIAKKVPLPGTQQATIVLTRVAGKQRILFVEPA